MKEKETLKTQDKKSEALLINAGIEQVEKGQVLDGKDVLMELKIKYNL